MNASRSRCVILVPTAGGIEPECAEGLERLERRGYSVWRHYGSSAIDQARSQMATDALAEGFEELMWIDSDIRFPDDAVDALRSAQLPIVCAIYPKKGMRELACHLDPSTKKITFGRGGDLLEIRYAAGGFLLTRREVYEKIRSDGDLPVCNTQFHRPNVPYFLPMVIDEDGKPWYLGEDYAFAERARRSGFRIMADTRIRLEHIGRCGYSWEDAGSDRERFDTYHFTVVSPSGRREAAN